MLSHWGSRSSRQRSAKTLHRLGAVLGLFALVVLLALQVAHTGDILLNVAASPAAGAFQRPPHSAGVMSALASVASGSPYKTHDAFLCPVCQLLSQARHSLMPIGPGVVLYTTSTMLSPIPDLPPLAPELTTATPRAPPYTS